MGPARLGQDWLPRTHVLKSEPPGAQARPARVRTLGGLLPSPWPPPAEEARCPLTTPEGRELAVPASSLVSASPSLSGAST